MQTLMFHTQLEPGLPAGVTHVSRSDLQVRTVYHVSVMGSHIILLNVPACRSQVSPDWVLTAKEGLRLAS